MCVMKRDSQDSNYLRIIPSIRNFWINYEANWKIISRKRMHHALADYGFGFMGALFWAFCNYLWRMQIRKKQILNDFVKERGWVIVILLRHVLAESFSTQAFWIFPMHKTLFWIFLFLIKIRVSVFDVFCVVTCCSSLSIAIMTTSAALPYNK